MKRLFAVMVAAMTLLLPSCDNTQKTPSGPSLHTFKATNEAMDGKSVVWLSGDKITLMGDGGAEAQTVRLLMGAGSSTGTFEVEMNSYNIYHALYPSSSVLATSGEGFTFELPRNREAVTDFAMFNTVWRAAKGTPESGLAFKNILGAVEFRLTGDFEVQRMKITASADSPALAGTFKYDVRSGEMTCESGVNTMTAELPSGVMLSSSPTSIIVLLPVGEYRDLSLILSNDAGNGYEYTVSGSVDVGRAAITKVADATYNPEYVHAPFIGNWHLTKFCNREVEVDIYLTLNDDDTFVLYQREEEYPLEVFEGMYNYDVATRVISGTYSDNVPWASTYTVSMSGEDMVWRSTSGEESLYERCEPSDMPNAATVKALRSGSVKRFL